MTQDEIIEMARQAGLYQDINVSFHQALKNFYGLAAAKEREACAVACEKEQEYWGWDKVFDAAKLIRARGEA